MFFHEFRVSPFPLRPQMPRAFPSYYYSIAASRRDVNVFSIFFHGSGFWEELAP
jgi:hypothetical protein